MHDHNDLLAKLRDTFRAFPTVTQVVIDEYQLRFATSDVEFCSYVAWEFRPKSGASVKLEGDYRNRSNDAYIVCRIIGQNIASVNSDTRENLVFDFASGDSLKLLKQPDRESYVITFKGEPDSGIYIC
jgi:hypothetical protein